MSDGLVQARWWTVKRVQALKAKSYTCPLCDMQLHAMSDHVLLVPEGDLSRRRHAHSTCVHRARADGLLPTQEEWQKAQTRDLGGRRPRLLARRPGDGTR